MAEILGCALEVTHMKGLRPALAHAVRRRFTFMNRNLLLIAFKRNNWAFVAFD
jgi:hypothetical protein